MKIVINKCYGGFSLSAAAVAMLAARKGRECYFFDSGGLGQEWKPVNIENAKQSLFLTAFDIPNPNEVLRRDKDWREQTDEERREYNRLYSEHYLDCRPEDRTDPDLVAVVEELGEEAASGALAKLRVVEIPDGIEWELDEYDGIENVAEKHRSWG